MCCQCDENEPVRDKNETDSVHIRYTIVPVREIRRFDAAQCSLSPSEQPVSVPY